MAKKPSESAGALTAGEYAAIHLRVPESGTPWIDEMVRKSRDLDTPAEEAKPAPAKKPSSSKVTDS